MRVDISPDDVSICSLPRGIGPTGKQMYIDIHRYVRLLAEDQTFEHCELKTTWGMLIHVFSGEAGRVTKAIMLDLLMLTNERVVSNDGIVVDRYVKIVEELLLDAKRQAKPASRLILLPGDVLA